MIDLLYMKQLFLENEVKVSERQLEQLDLYAEMLVDWNTRVNLTAIKEPTEIAVKHFLDSAMLLKYIDKGVSLIDVGTGAGFPGIPCKILDDAIQLTLLDSLNKRINFLDAVCTNIGIKARTIHARAEDGARTMLREAFDVATARAVAGLNVLSEYCLPYVKVGGVFVALKGHDISTEINEASDVIERLGGRIEDVWQYSLCESSRSMVVIRKVLPTINRYPRMAGKVK